MFKGYIYILKNQKGNFYIGSTDNLERRFAQHKNKHTRTTANRFQEFEPVLVQEFPNLGLARKIEQKIKKLKRKDYIEKMIKEGYIRIATN